MLFGRAVEQGEIDKVLAAAREGRSGALVIRGEAGIGKSALLEYAARSANGPVVLRALAAPFEAQLPFAALQLLLHPVQDRIDQLPGAQAEALRSALALGPETVRDRFLVGLAALTLLSDLAAGGPVLCLIDDAHWLDEASADALLFAARRLQAEGIVLVFAARDEAGSLRGCGLPELRLATLPDRTAEALLAAHAGDLAPQVRRRILQEAAGNPLALIELPAALTPEQRSGRLGPLPFAVETGSVSLRVQTSFLAQLNRLPERTRSVLLVAAADDTADLATILRAAGDVGGTVCDLEPAERAGLVQVSGTTLTFRHPLVRSAAYRTAPHHQRMAAHLALAGALAGQAHADRRSWHLAAGTVGPDEQVAGALERTAVRARELQGAAAASAAYERAAELSSDDRHRAGRLTAAAELAVLAGQPHRALALAERGRASLPGQPAGDHDPYVRARLTHVEATLEYEQGSPSKAGRILVDGARELVSVEQFGGDNTATATRMLADAVRNASLACDPGLICHVDAALNALEDSPLARAMCTVARVVGDEVVTDFSPIRAAIRFLRAAPDEIWDQHLLAASLSFLIGDEAGAYEVSAGLAGYCRQRGMIGVLPQALGLLAQAQLLRNRLDEAAAAATEALAIATDIGQPQRAGDLRGLLAWLAAVAGEEERCLDYVSQVGEGGHVMGTWAAGLLDLGLGRPAQALARLAGLWDQADRPQPLALYAAPDLIEAAVRAGQPDVAKEPLHRLEDWAAAVDRPWAAAVVTRCRGLLSDGAEAEGCFASALRMLEDATELRFQRARTLLVYGEWLRRAQRRADARHRLRTAFEEFDLLGATPWTQRAHSELRATGDTTAPRARGPIGRLTPQELQVVRLAAAGLSNREIGAELFLSPRTVGHHLYKAYPKLGVASRCELAELELDG